MSPLGAVWVAQQADAFASSLRQLHRSPRTVEGYSDDLAKFVPWFDTIAQRHPGLARDKTLALAAREYLADLERRGNAASSIRRRLACLRSFGRFLQDSDILPANPFIRIETPKIPQRLPKSPEAEDMNAILKAASKAGPRDAALVTLLACCGLRLSEAVHVRLKDVSRGRREVRVIGKGNKERAVPLPGKSLEVLEAHIADLRYTDGPLFPGRKRGTDGIRLPISTWRARRIVYELAKRATGKRWWPHSLRHGYATGLLDSGADVRVVQELLGHSNLNTTAIYLHASDARKKTAADKLPFRP